MFINYGLFREMSSLEKRTHFSNDLEHVFITKPSPNPLPEGEGLKTIRFVKLKLRITSKAWT